MGAVPEAELQAFFEEQIADALADLRRHQVAFGDVCACGDVVPCLSARQLAERAIYYRERLEATTLPKVPARQVRVWAGWRSWWPMWSRPA